MVEVVIEGKVLRWGNSFGIRIKKADLERAGLRAGDEARIHVEPKAGAIDLSGFPLIHSGHADTAARHDEVLGRALWERHQGRRPREE